MASILVAGVRQQQPQDLKGIDMKCAVCIHTGEKIPRPATTQVNGTAVCDQHCQHAPRNAFPIAFGEDGN
jgi:hypothetical protein